jgi:hypothetical protein
MEGRSSESIREAAAQRARQPRVLGVQELDFERPLRLALTRWISWEAPSPEVRGIDLRWCVHEPQDQEATGAFLAVLESGDSTVDELAERTGRPLEAARRFANELFQVGALQVSSPHGVPALAYYDHAINLARIHAAVLGVMEARSRLMHGAETRRLLLGILVEEYHFICAAASHISGTISNNPSDRMATLLSHYLGEEYWHGKWVEEGLRAAGFRDHDLHSASPLPTTLALINLLRWTGASDRACYCLFMGLAEGRANMQEAVVRDWEPYFRQQVLPEKVFRPFYEHSLMDADHDHGSLFREPFAEFPDVSLERRVQLEKKLFQYAHAYRAYYEGILEFYSAEQGPDYLAYA